EQGVGEILPGERIIPEEQLINAVEKANKSFEPFDRRFEVSIHEKTKAVMVKVINSVNDEVIREIPPEKILDMVAYMLEIAGIIVDERV
ncbi:MAG: flagellar protein FlaG, partial [Clostridiales bacterium]|nr:flagellar protein FlaG [Clostridiales bacterium]